MERFLEKTIKLGGNQSGAASIYASLAIMVILSLIAITFAKIMGENYRQIAESQYHLQAYYAAESAINDVRAEIHKNIRRTTQDKDADTDLTVEYDNTVIDLTALWAGNANSDSGAQFGQAIDVLDNFLAVGAPGVSVIPAVDHGVVYVFKRTSSTTDWSDANGGIIYRILPPDHDQPNNGQFGAAVSLHKQDGRYFLAIGAPENGGGVVYLYSFDPNLHWTAKHRIADLGTRPTNLDASIIDHDISIGDANAQFGAAVVLRGSTLFVGAPGMDRVFHLQKAESNGKWSQNKIETQAIVDLDFGASLALYDNRLVIGSLYNGPNIKDQIDEYTLEGNSWNKTNTVKNGTNGMANKVNLSAEDKFGASIDMSGSLLAVGAPGDDDMDSDAGGVHIFERRQSKWIRKHKISKAATADFQTEVSNLSPNDHFGRGLALFDDLLVVGSPGGNKIHFFKVDTNDILNDILSAGLDQDCPAEQDAHEAWRNGTLIEDGNIRYLCVGVNVAPQSLIYDKVGVDRSLLLHLEPVNEDHDDVNLEELTIAWDKSDLSRKTTLATDPPKFEQANNWPDIPVLRVQITVVDTERSFTRSNLNNNTRVFFLYPSTAIQKDGSWPDPGTDGKIIGCEETVKGPICKAVLKLPAADKINGTSDSQHQLIYIVRVQSIYGPAAVTIAGEHGAGEASSFKNLQAIVTATGQSSYVFERLRERVPLRPIYDLPEYGIDSAEDLCKILVTDDYHGVYLFDQEPLNGLTGKSSCSLRRN